MSRSLYTKLVLIMMLIILSLTSVVGAFLMSEIRAFYLEDFYAQMKSLFENSEFMDTLYKAADDEDAVALLNERVQVYSGQLGIDSRSRDYYILDGNTGAPFLDAGSGSETELNATANILMAITGSEGDQSDRNAAFMDVAIPVSGESGRFIIYVIDNKSAVYSLSNSLFEIILKAMLIGLAISVALSLLLAKTIVTPIQQLTVAAEKVAAGDFSRKPDSDANDEIGILTHTFNEMAGQLERNIDDLRRSETMRREFVANVSHELRTPITSIRTYAETLQDSTGISADMTGEFLSVIVNESDRMTKIVQDLLTLSKFDAGSYEFRFERFSIEKSLRDVYNAMHLEAHRYGHTFTLDLKTELPEIVGDRARIEQVLMNLVSNAIKYTRNDGNIRLIASCRDNSLKIVVKDNGVGIPEEDIPKIFDRFYRVDKARSRESGGTGLGLSIVHEIVTRHKGKISLTSKLGKGSEFTVLLPVEGPPNDE